MTEECPGQGRCHGCMDWCDLCGQVGKVCDSPECDAHRRAEEVEAEWEATERELAADARKMLDAFHVRLEEVGSQTVLPAAGSLRDRAGKKWALKSAMSSFQASLSEMSRAREARDEYALARRSGLYSMVPRRA